MNRRVFLGGAAGVAMAGITDARKTLTPIIDTHIHLFDPTRPQGVPWPPNDDAALYKPALPARYRDIAGPLGIVGAIEVECSAWVEDNQWVLDIAEKDNIIVGTIGNLEPGAPDFQKHLERFHRNPLFRGIRYGNLWDRDLGDGLAKPAFVGDLKKLAEADLVLDSANPTPKLITDLLHLSDKVPELRIVIDHLPQMDTHTAAHLRELAARPQVYVKISEVLRRVDGRVPHDLAFYKPRLDEIYGMFGPDRVLYGSDWPNSDHWAPYGDVLSIVREYFAGRTEEEREKYFWKNSIAAYRWVRHDQTQPTI